MFCTGLIGADLIKPWLGTTITKSEFIPPTIYNCNTKAGAATGGLLALAGGIAALLIPGIGLPLVAGSVLTVLLGSGAVAGIGGLIGALEGWYIPEKQAKLYSERVSQGDYLVIIEGTESEIHQAEKILSRWGIQEWQIFASPTV